MDSTVGAEEVSSLKVIEVIFTASVAAALSQYKQEWNPDLHGNPVPVELAFQRPLAFVCAASKSPAH